MRKDEKQKSYNQNFRGYPELHTIFLKMRKDEKQKSYHKKIIKLVEGTLNYIIFFWKCARMKTQKVITKNLEVDELYRMSTTRALKNVSLKRYLRLKFQDNTMCGFSWSRIPWDWVGIFAKSIPWVWLRIVLNSTQGFWLQICNKENLGKFYTIIH